MCVYGDRGVYLAVGRSSEIMLNYLFAVVDARRASVFFTFHVLLAQNTTLRAGFVPRKPAHCEHLSIYN